MAMIETLTIQIDASEALRIVNGIEIRFAQTLRKLPYVEAADGTKWADVSALFDLADRLEAG